MGHDDVHRPYPKPGRDYVADSMEPSEPWEWLLRFWRGEVQGANEWLSSIDVLEQVRFFATGDSSAPGAAFHLASLSLYSSLRKGDFDGVTTLCCRLQEEGIFEMDQTLEKLRISMLETLVAYRTQSNDERLVSAITACRREIPVDSSFPLTRLPRFPASRLPNFPASRP